MPYLRTLSSFRDGVRRLAIAKGDNALKEILALSDKLRDSDLVPLGVALDDQEGARVNTPSHFPPTSFWPSSCLLCPCSMPTLLPLHPRPRLSPLE